MNSIYVVSVVGASLFGLLVAGATGWFVSKLFRGSTIKEITSTANEIIELYDNKLDILEKDLQSAREEIREMHTALARLKDRNELLEELLLKAGAANVQIPK